MAHVAFNALSPWAGAEHGWRTYLGKSGSRVFKGRKSIKLSAANRAWWAISGKKGKGSSRGRDESAPKPMELDSLPVCDSGSPAAGAPKKKPETLKSCLKTPTESSDPGSSGESVMSAASSVPIGPRKRSSVGMSLPICDTPFAYMLRGMRSVACVTEEHEFFDCDQGFAEVFELDFPELCCGDHDFACCGSRMLAAPLGRTHDLSSRTHDLRSRTHDLCSRTHDLCSRTHDLSSRTHDLCGRTHDLSSRMHDLGSCRLSESVLCRMQVAMSQCLKVARHGLKVAQRVLHVLCPDLRAGFCQALRFHSAEASELNSGERCFFERERSERFPSRRHLLPKLLFLILLVLWGYDGPYGGGCYAFGSVGFGCWNGCCRGWWSNNRFGRSMGTMGSYSPSHGCIGIHSSRCTTYSHGSIAIHSSRCTSYHHGSIGIHSSRCTSYHHGSIGIHSYRCTSYVSGLFFGYHAKRWLEYGASGSGGATNQVCCTTGRRKAFRLCQLVEVGIYVGPQISGKAIWCHYHQLGCGFFWRSTKYWWAHHGPGLGPIFDSIVERFIAARICSSKSDANGILRAGGAGMAKIPTRPCKWGPELHKGPDWQCCRAQRRLYSTGLPACPRNRGYSRPNNGWREIFAGVRKIAPIGARMGRSKAHCGGRISYAPILCQRPRCSYAVLTGGRCANGTGSSKHYGSWRIDQRLGAGSRQTFCNGPHWDYHPINGDRGLDASKLHPKSKRRGRRPCKDARGSPPDGVHPYVAALQRDASVSPGDAIESIGGRNRGGVQQLCCFERHTCSIHRLLRLSGVIWGWSDQTTFGYPPIGTCASSTTTAYFGLRGTGSWPGTTVECCCYRYDWAGDYVSPRQCLGDRTAEVYGLAFATAAGGGAFTLSGLGVSSAGGGIVFERTNRAVFVAHIAPERANEVVYNPWIGCTGVVREAHGCTGVVREAQQFAASQDPRTSASVPRPANRGTSLRFRRDKDPLLDWGLWRMFKPMLGWWKMRNPELDWFLGGPRFELWNLKDKTPKRPRPNRGGTSLFLPRQENWWCHMDSGMSGSAWLVSGSAWLVSGSTWLVSGSAWLVSGSAWLVSGSAWLVSGSAWLVSGSAWFCDR